MACQSRPLLGPGCGSLGTFVVPADHLVFKMCSHGGHRQGGPPPTVATRARLRMRTFRLWPRRRLQLTSKGQYDPEVTIARGVESRATPGLRERTAESGEQDGYVPMLTGDRTQVRCPGRMALGRSQPHVPLCKMVP